MSRPLAVALMGPTAAGKTGLAVEWAERFGMDIISVDSALVYRGMDIGTAKPDQDLLARAPHRLIDIREPEQPYSAAEFAADAGREMADITESGRVPLLVGGTGLYFRALLEGLSPLPAADPALRAKLADELETDGLERLHQKLARLDPEAAHRINRNDTQRILRALEVIELTGCSLSVLQNPVEAQGLGYQVLKLVICPSERSVLHHRIAQRFDQMVAAGFETELRRLAARPGFDESLPAMRAVGYRQGWPWLRRECTLEQWREKSVIATRQLAKRQLTWLRREQGALWYDPDRQSTRLELLEKVRKFLETHPDRSQFMQNAGN